MVWIVGVLGLMFGACFGIVIMAFLMIGRDDVDLLIDEDDEL